MLSRFFFEEMRGHHVERERYRSIFLRQRLFDRARLISYRQSGRRFFRLPYRHIRDVVADAAHAEILGEVDEIAAVAATEIKHLSERIQEFALVMTLKKA